MNTRRASRIAYRLVLRIHPGLFRERFGGEMLGIFDEECKSGVPVRLLCDGVLSLLRQHAKVQRELPPASAGFEVLAFDSGFGAPLIFQALLLSLMLFIGSIFFLRQRFPSHFLIHRPPSALRAIFTLQAPAQFTTLPDTHKNLP